MMRGGSAMNKVSGVLFCVICICSCWEPALASRLKEKGQPGTSLWGTVYNLFNQLQKGSVLSSDVTLSGPIPTTLQSEDVGPARMLAEPVWPKPQGSVRLHQTIDVYGEFNGGYKMYWGLGDGGNGEDQAPIFMVYPGGVVRNVIIGSPAGDGINCRGSCKIINVWWMDVGEDAATLRGKDPNQVMEIIGGGARHASDKVFQHNGPGTVVIRNFQAEDIGKLYRACGSCDNMKRHVVIENVRLANVHTAVAGININTGDTARFRDITFFSQPKRIDVCQKYRANWGSSYKIQGGGPDGNHCMFNPSTVRYVNGGLNEGPRRSGGGSRGKVVRRRVVRRRSPSKKPARAMKRKRGRKNRRRRAASH